MRYASAGTRLRSKARSFFLIMAIAATSGAWAQSPSLPSGSPAPGDANAQADIPFVAENLPLFKSFALSNGIHVYVKETNANRVRDLSLVLLGGSLEEPPSRAGWANLVLKTMARGSISWPYEKASALLDETSSTISAGSQFEYSTFNLTVLDKYFEQILPIWSDMIRNPSFAQSDFERSKSDAILAIQSKDQNPWAMTQKIANEKFFVGHPYAITPEGTEATIGTTTTDDMKAWYSAHFSADRIFIVAVGNFDLVALKADLETALGGLPDLRLGKVAAPPPFPVGPRGGRLYAEPDEQSKGVAYVRGDFAAPAPGAADYMATNLAMKMFSDLLFAIVRDKYGAVYTPSALIRGFEANYGSILMYKTAAAEKIKAYIDEAAGVLAGGDCLSMDPTMKVGASPYMAVGEALPIYKTLYSNEYFDAVRTNAAVAALMIRSVISVGKPYDWLYDLGRIASVDASQVQRAFDAYILGGNFTWVAVGDPVIVGKLPAADFSGFSAGR